MRWFRIGAATGEIIIYPDDLTGIAATDAVRLEGNAKPGGCLIDLAIFAALPDQFKNLYEDQENVIAKGEVFQARRIQMAQGALEQDIDPIKGATKRGSYKLALQEKLWKVCPAG